MAPLTTDRQDSQELMKAHTHKNRRKEKIHKPFA